MRDKVFWFVLLVAATCVPGAAQEPVQETRAKSPKKFALSVEAAILAEIRNVQLLRSDARYAEALERATAVVERAERQLGPEHHFTLVSVDTLARLYAELGRNGEAEPLYLRTLALSEEVLGAEHLITLRSVNSLAALYESQGRYAEAEPLFLRTLSTQERQAGIEHPSTLNSINNLAVLYRSQGRYTEAESLYLRALTASENRLGKEHPDTLSTVNGLARLYALQGRYSEAEPLQLRALSAQERVLGSDHPSTLISVNNLAVLYKSQGRYAEAEPLFLRALTASENRLGIEHPSTLASVNNLAVLYTFQGRHAEAKPLLVRQVAVLERLLWREHPDTIVATENLAVNKLATSDPEALNFAGLGMGLTRKRARIADASRAQQGVDPASRIGPTAFLYARAARSAGERPPLNDPFEALQLVQATSVGHALARSAALATLDSTNLALALEREDVVRQIDSVDSAFASAAGADGGGAAMTELLARRSKLFERVTAIDAALEASNPRYFQLIRPQPVSLDALQKGVNQGPALLRADEALILLTPGDARFPAGQRRGFVFAVTREGAAWVELPLDPEPLADLITEVREGSAIIDPRIQQPVPRKRAKALYDAMFGAPEIARLVAGKPSWIISPQGQLLSTPFAALVTRDPQGDDDDPEAWAGTAWLGAERALAILPEVHMLHALRGLDRAAGAASAPYFGIADPAFEGQGNAAELQPAASFFRGAVGSPDAIIKLTPLPNTRNEVEAVARALGAGPESMLTGREATEIALRARAARLADSRVVHFATHALVSGEMGGLTQPALALMPPRDTEGVEETNDGLLTAAEAATLKLNADWVILSACNTAAGEGKGAEGLSGLARSFFYAGAASLLVSQWKVRDDSGAMLVAETVKAFAADESIGRAEALRRAIRKVSISRNARGESFAHPQDWAPFILVGVDR